MLSYLLFVVALISLWSSLSSANGRCNFNGYCDNSEDPFDCVDCAACNNDGICSSFENLHCEDCKPCDSNAKCDSYENPSVCSTLFGGDCFNGNVMGILQIKDGYMWDPLKKEYFVARGFCLSSLERSHFSSADVEAS